MMTTRILVLIAGATTGRCSENSDSNVFLSNSPSCNTQTSCESCYASSVLCHWCKDIPPETLALASKSSHSESPGSCHAKFSRHGCQVGDACTADDCSERHTCSACNMGGCKWCGAAQKCVSMYSWTCALPTVCLPNDECKRTAPEFFGYKYGVAGWVVALAVLAYMGMVAFTVSALYLCYGRDRSSYAVIGDENAIGGKRKWVFKIFAIACGVLLLGTGALMSMTLIYCPSVPEVDMCNAQVLWSDTIAMIMKSITTGKTNVESEVLITVYNPNRIGGYLNSASGNIYYKSNSVGSIDISEFEIVPGSATDSLAVLTFNGFDNIAEIYYDFNVKHKLLLEFEMFATFTVGKHRLSSIIPKFQVNVNDPPPQKYCKCHDGISAKDSSSPKTVEGSIDYETL